MPTAFFTARRCCNTSWWNGHNVSHTIQLQEAVVEHLCSEMHLMVNSLTPSPWSHYDAPKTSRNLYLWDHSILRFTATHVWLLNCIWCMRSELLYQATCISKHAGSETSRMRLPAKHRIWTENVRTCILPKSSSQDASQRSTRILLEFLKCHPTLQSIPRF